MFVRFVNTAIFFNVITNGNKEATIFNYCFEFFKMYHIFLKETNG